MNMRYILLALLMSNLAISYPLILTELGYNTTNKTLGNVLRKLPLDIPNTWTLRDIAILFERLNGTCSCHLRFFIARAHEPVLLSNDSTLAELGNPDEIGCTNTGSSRDSARVNEFLKTYSNPTTQATTATTSAAATASTAAK